MITTFQLCTMFFMLCLTMKFILDLRKDIFVAENSEPLWVVSTQRVKPARYTIRNIVLSGRKLSNSVTLHQESLILGNGMFDDVYIDTSGHRVKLYLNVQRDKIFLSVLKGSVMIDNNTFVANKKEIIPLEEFSQVKIEDVLLRFTKSRR